MGKGNRRKGARRNREKKEGRGNRVSIEKG